jgi:hypothetical protein
MAALRRGATFETFAHVYVAKGGLRVWQGATTIPRFTLQSVNNVGATPMLGGLTNRSRERKADDARYKQNSTDGSSCHSAFLKPNFLEIQMAAGVRKA